MRIRNTIFAIILIVFLVSIYQNIMAFKDGIVGLTKKDANPIGCVCHNFKPNDTVSVKITGPASVRANDTAIYVLNIANGPAVAGGCDIATSLGNVYTSALDTILRRAEAFTGSGFELTHKEPKMFTGDTLKFYFKYVAPATPNVVDTIFANGNSVNHDTTSDNDKWNYAENFLITVLPPVGISENISDVNSFKLKQNYPNPFNPETKISFNISKSSNISLQVFDVTGKAIADLIDNKFYTTGNYSVSFNAGQYNLTSGVYFYKLSANSVSELKKMILVK
ncbi:MAG TPA: T9SS type A sorting domain-containing protein [Ignavibacteria bacterium]|nr:T9SS type A sorting domain-containing protein [Ignavibacteria bacterium]